LRCIYETDTKLLKSTLPRISYKHKIIPADAYRTCWIPRHF